MATAKVNTEEVKRLAEKALDEISTIEKQHITPFQPARKKRIKAIYDLCRACVDSTMSISSADWEDITYFSD